MSKISRDTFKRLTLLAALAEFDDGAYGLKRLHKTVYIALRTLDVRPFGFIKYNYGQYSEDLDETKDQMLALSYVEAMPLPKKSREGDWVTIGGNKYRIPRLALKTYFRDVFGRVNPDLGNSLHTTITRYGYLPEQQLMEFVYSLPEFETTPDYGTFFESNLPESVEVPLSETECGYLDDILNPNFVLEEPALVEAPLSDTQRDQRWRAVRNLARRLRDYRTEWSGVEEDIGVHRLVPPDIGTVTIRRLR